jgi:hypothetical protein
VAIRKLLFILVVFFTAACGAPRPATPTTTPSDSLAFDESADTLIIDADSRGHGSGPFPFELCSHVDNIRVWGDGRIVFANFGPGYRVLSGQLTSDKMARLIKFLYDQIFSKAWTPEPAPAGTYFGLAIHLQSGTLSYSWGEPSEPPIYQQLLAQIDPHDLTPFVPQKAQLMVAPIAAANPVLPEPLVWPAQLGLSLSQVGPGGMPISGKTLDYVWSVSNHAGILQFKEASHDYTVWLEMPEISIPDPRYGCP